ncbi:MAG: PAS domain S-box protein [Propylenella sp.]
MAVPNQNGADARIFHFPQSEELLRTIMENAAVGMALVGMDGRVSYANRVYAEMFGYQLNECIGLQVANIVHPDDQPLAQQQLEQLIKGEIRQYRVERRYLRKDGRVFWGLASAALLRHERTRRPIYATVQIVDIDRQKRAEAALAESESRWNFALEGAEQGVWDHDLRTRRAFFSRTWKLMRGFDAEAEIDSSLEAWLERIHPEDRDRVLAIVGRLDSGELRQNCFEYRERHRDGHWIWILSRGKPVEWMPDGRPARMVGTDTDITSLKAAESALAEERERLRVTLRSIADGVISTDAEGRVTFINPVAEQMTGWTSSEALGLRIGDVLVLAGREGELSENPVAECLARREARYVDEDLVLVSRSGRRIDIRNSAAPLVTPAGEIFGAVLAFQDVSRSRARQRELAHSAMHDDLTGLPNRSAFDRRLEEARAEAGSELREHALCFIDLDRFKAVNDNAGHAAGDALLQRVARAIRKCARRRDFAARIGGDEFALILADCSLTTAKRVARQVIDTISDIRFTRQGSTYRIGASVGITTITHTSPRPAALMREADVACYAAKASGGDSVVTHDRARTEFSEVAGEPPLAAVMTRR